MRPTSIHVRGGSTSDTRVTMRAIRGRLNSYINQRAKKVTKAELAKLDLVKCRKTRAVYKTPYLALSFILGCKYGAKTVLGWSKFCMFYVYPGLRDWIEQASKL